MIGTSPLGSGFVASGASTHAGYRRAVNEDAFLDRPDVKLWAVADGVGGGRDGSYASKLVIDSLGQLTSADKKSFEPSDVRRSLEQANQRLREANRGNPHTMSSTVVVLGFNGGTFYWAWAGDSRLYLLRSGQLLRLTRDHSLTQSLIEDGKISAEHVAYRSSDNIIVRAVGAAESLPLDTGEERLAEQDVFLLCSDGLTKMVADETVRTILLHNSPGDAANALVEAALRAGGRDNVTALVVSGGAPARDAGADQRLS